MELTAYSMCPGGKNQKLKFCCRDLLGDLQKIQKAVEARQFSAALNHVDQLLEKHPDRECLWTFKTLLMRVQRPSEEAAEAADAFVERFPDNPVALAEKSLIAAITEGGFAGQSWLERSLAAMDVDRPQMWHQRQWQACRVLAEVLADERHIPAALAACEAALAINEEDEELHELRRRIQLDGSMPLFVRMRSEWPLASDAQKIEDRLPQLATLQSRFRWRALEEQVTALAEELPENITVLRWLVHARLLLGKYPEARAILAPRALPTEELDRKRLGGDLAAILLMEEYYFGDGVPEITLTYSIDEVDEVNERLASDSRLVRIEIAPEDLPREDDEPPPIAGYRMRKGLPRADRESIQELVDSPQGMVLLFGRQTDREPRLVIARIHAEQEAGVRERAAQWLGDRGVEPTREESESPLTRSLWDLLAIQTAYRQEMSTGAQLDWTLDDAQRVYVTEVWADRQMGLFDGKSPRQAGEDPQYHLRLEAAIRVVTAMFLPGKGRDQVNLLRQAVKLPPESTELIDASDAGISEVMMEDWDRIDLDKLSSDQLQELYAVAATVNLELASRRAALKVVERKDECRPENVSAAYMTASRYADTAEETLELVAQGKQYAQQHGLSDGLFHLIELPVLLEERRAEEFSRTFTHALEHHRDEEAVTNGLVQMLTNMGLVDEQGHVRFPGGMADHAETDAASQGQGGLWTPDQEQPGGGTSKIWLPGDD